MKTIKNNKDILNRVEKLEFMFPKMKIDAREYIIGFIEPIEKYLDYKIIDRIKIPNNKYFDEDTLDRYILNFLTIDELKILINSINK